jgi:hypothetical protein
VSVLAVGTSSRPPLNVISSSCVIQARHIPHVRRIIIARRSFKVRVQCGHLCTLGLWAWIWEEEVVQPPKPLVNDDTREASSALTTASTGNQPASDMTLPSASEMPPVSPQRRRIWEMASAFGERAVSWGKVGRIRKRRRWKGERRRVEVASPSLFPSFCPIFIPSSPLPGSIHWTHPHSRIATLCVEGPRQMQLFPHQARRTELLLPR